MNTNIEIQEMPKMNLAYIAHKGVEGLENTFDQIVGWAIGKGLLSNNDAHVCRVFHDSFKFTDAKEVRMSVGIISNNELSAEAPIQMATLEGGKSIVGHFIIEPIEFENAWKGLFAWMSDNGYKKADRFPFEIYHNNFNDHPEKKCIVDLFIPIE